MNFKEGDRFTCIGTVLCPEGRTAEVIFDGSKNRNSVEYTAMKLVEPNPVICDPNSPEAQALIGKEVYFSDSFSGVSEEDATKGFLKSIDAGASFPFKISSGEWKFIQAVEEKPVKKMTVAEVCKALGYYVEIVK